MRSIGLPLLFTISYKLSAKVLKGRDFNTPPFREGAGVRFLIGFSEILIIVENFHTSDISQIKINYKLRLFDLTQKLFRQGVG